jgi:hypothetical protein
MQPRTALECKLATQMIAVHDASLKFLSKATQEDQYPESVERNLILATRCMNLWLKQVEAMQRLQGKPWQQKIVVQHVNVKEGGQAIVGAVTAKGEGG